MNEHPQALIHLAQNFVFFAQPIYYELIIRINKTTTMLMSESARQAFDAFYQRANKLNLNTDTINHYKANILHAFGCSDFIQRIATQYCEKFLQILPDLNQSLTTSGELINGQELNIDDYHLAALQHDLQQDLSNCTSEEEALAIIRQYRHLNMLKIAWADFHHIQSIQTSLLATSYLANILICEANNYVYTELIKRHGAPEQNQKLIIMGMGKLGGNELNFSSDIDLIFAYPAKGVCDGKKETEHQVFFTRAAQRLIKMLDQVTQDGRVFRVDMRLRPLGESGPLVLPFSALESYYLEQGRQWERFAMQKMRIVNDTPWNNELYGIITPFMYRKYIDFTTVDAIREMKQMIEKEVRRRQISSNIKLGKGGIREVEFFVQSLQLIHAGRHIQCQASSILKAMHELELVDLLASDERQQIQADYLFLRKVEHYLQAFNDEQTQTLPDSKLHQQRLCVLLNCENLGAYQLIIEQCMARINAIFSTLVDDANQSDETQQNDEYSALFDDIWHLSLSPDEMHQVCEHLLSKSACDLLQEHLGHFKKKIERSGVSARAVKSVNKLVPLLLQEFDIDNKNLDIAQVSGLFGILQTISGRVTYIDLLLEHPDVRKRLLVLCKKSPWISEQISHYPLLLDELLNPIYLEKNDISLTQYKQDCADQLRQTLLRVDLEDVEMVMDRLREFKHTNQLRIAAADISGTLAINQVSDRLTLLAEVLMAQVIEYAWQQISKLFGQPSGNTADAKNFALIAYGKFGGIELSYGSDLDLVFLHGADLSLQTDDSGSRKQISNQEFYIKLVQRICHICSTKTYIGILYDIDLRLRPSGNSGLLVSHIESFFDYQNNTAWTWEHQALVRSRAVIAPAHLSKRFNEIKTHIICKQRDEAELKQAVFDMRNKMREHLQKDTLDKIDIKQSNGGIVDVEFMVQFWVLSQAHQYNQLSLWSDNLRLLETLEKHQVISATQASSLGKAYLTIRHSSHRLQLANQQYARRGKKLEEAMQQVQNIFNRVFNYNT